VRRIILITVIAVAAFAVMLIARLPASWIIPAAPGAYSCPLPGGTLWNGACSGLVMQGRTVGDVTWKLHPLPLLTGTVAAHVTLTRPDASADADLAAGLSGNHIQLRNLKAHLPLDPALIPQLPPGLRGSAHMDLALVRINKGAITDLKGHIEAQDLHRIGSNPARFGSYSLDFPGGTPQPTGELRDLGGPLSVQGTLRITPEPGFDLKGTVAARSTAPADLAKEIEYLGSPDAQGRRPFALAATF